MIFIQLGFPVYQYYAEGAILNNTLKNAPDKEELEIIKYINGDDPYSISLENWVAFDDVDYWRSPTSL